VSQALSRPIASGSPQASTSTRPSDRLLARQDKPSSSAWRRVDARKNTPCTFPEMKQRTQMVFEDLSIGSIQLEADPADFSRI
jgi:hypothetical protein